MLITAAAILVAIVATALLSFARFTHTDAWRATVTPLASITGSGSEFALKPLDIEGAWHVGGGAQDGVGDKRQAGFVAIGIISLFAAAVEAPAE